MVSLNLHDTLNTFKADNSESRPLLFCYLLFSAVCIHLQQRLVKCCHFDRVFFAIAS